MSKLFNLKEWVTISDAAKHLATVFGEDVTEADVLYFGLQKKLTLSVHFVNHTYACRGKIVGIEDVEWGELPGVMTSTLERIPDSEKGKPIRYISSLPIDDEKNLFLNFSDDVITLDGVWDLPMVGSERLDVEHRYQLLTNGPAVTLTNLEGAFVQRDEGEMWRLLESMDENEYQNGSRAQLDKLKKHIADEKIATAQADELLEQHKQWRKKYQDDKKSRPNKEDYYPAPALPSDGVWVVRTANLGRFLQNISPASESFEKPVGTKERNTLLKIIATLLAMSDLKGGTYKKAQAIERLSKEAGIGVSVNSIDKYLKEVESDFPTSIQK